MTKLQTSFFSLKTEKKEAISFLEKSMPQLEWIIAKKESEFILPMIMVARVRSDLKSVPEKLQELSIATFAFTDPRRNVLLVTSYHSHAGLSLSPEALLSDSRTEGKIFGHAWIEKFYVPYETPVIGNTLSKVYGAFNPESEEYQNDFEEAFKVLVDKTLIPSVARIEKVFAI